MCNELEEQHAIQLSFVITILLPLLELSVYLRMFSTRSKLKKEAQIHELRGVMSLHLHMPASHRLQKHMKTGKLTAHQFF